ncbi:DUF6712 family protein [Maribacter dokdonensis]|nr:hypothetical protein [Maribacter dokdonensis]
MPNISRGWEKESGKIQTCIDDAEEVDLFEQLGNFYFELIAKADDEDFDNLLNGCEFEFEGVKMKHSGLRKYVAGLAYVRYLGVSNMTHTPHGYVNKLTQNSEPVSYNQIKDEKKEVQRAASIRFKTISNYLELNPEIFTSYNPKKSNSHSYNSLKTSTLR